jgi:CheY-like chemotaxis protein
MKPQSPAPCSLIVEDDALLRAVACCIVEDLGFRAMEAECAEAAMTLLERHGSSIRLLLTDVHMPGEVDGFQLAQRCVERWPHISVLVMSAQATPQPDELPEGADFISKPLTADIVQARLQKLISDEDAG